MLKRVIGAGLSGGVVLIVWTFVFNAVLGFQSSLDMNRIPAEGLVYELLQEHFIEPGRYICNPAPTSGEQVQGEGPVFTVLYSGVGHEAAGTLMWISLVLFFLTPLIAAWMLSQTSRRIQSSYALKVIYFVVLGLFIALVKDVPKFGIGGYPLADAMAFAVNDIAMWTLVGLVVAWRVRPLEVVDSLHQDLLTEDNR
jgi:hypothetical protein